LKSWPLKAFRTPHEKVHQVKANDTNLAVFAEHRARKASLQGPIEAGIINRFERRAAAQINANRKPPD
jgi:hypothetical protein